MKDNAASDYIRRYYGGRVRWYRQGSYRNALDYFNRPDDRRRADVTDGGNTLIIYRVRQADNATRPDSRIRH